MNHPSPGTTSATRLLPGACMVGLVLAWGTPEVMALTGAEYDTALAAIYYTRRDNLDRARRLLDGIRFVKGIDPATDPADPSISDAQLRTSYWANDLLVPDGASPWIDTPETTIGNVAWAGIASIQTNHFPIPTDAQTWGALAGIDTDDRHEQALPLVSHTPLNDPTGLVVIDDLGHGRTYQGVRFSTGGQHVQLENTAGYALPIAAGLEDGWLTGQPGDSPDRWGNELALLIDQLDAIRTTADGSEFLPNAPASASVNFVVLGLLSLIRYPRRAAWDRLSQQVPIS